MDRGQHVNGNSSLVRVIHQDTPHSFFVVARGAQNRPSHPRMLNCFFILDYTPEPADRLDRAQFLRAELWRRRGSASCLIQL